MIFIDTIKKLNAPRKKANPENEILSWGDKMPEYIANSILFVVAFFAAIVALLAFGSLTSANAAQVQDCTIWQVTPSAKRGYQKIKVHALSEAEKGEDRLATAKYLADYILERSDYRVVHVLLFQKETNSDNETAKGKLYHGEVIYAPDEGWSGEYTNDLNSDKVDGYEWAFATKVDHTVLNNFRYTTDSTSCDPKSVLTERQ